ncbi:MAG TPA: helix-turn-helix transcriptional regulator [Streptosporangiaceae bacterium]|nr:helix-turn-helix transcriptional regulator [Streptosporangiaceae bacterium]
MTAGQPTSRGQGDAGSVPAPRSWTTAVDGARLRQARREHALSRAELAGAAGISVATLARLERQPRTRCRCRTLARLALALGEDPASTTLRPVS